MGVRIQELPETTGINKEDLLIVEDGKKKKKGTVQQLDEALGASQLKEDLSYLNKKDDVTFTVSDTLDEAGSHKKYVSIPVNSIVIFKNTSNNLMTLNIGDGTSEQNVSKSVKIGEEIKFTANMNANYIRYPASNSPFNRSRVIYSPLVTIPQGNPLS